MFIIGESFQPNLIFLGKSKTIFVARKVCYSSLFTNLVGWHAGADSFPLSDIILAQLACPLRGLMFWLHSGITSLSLYKHGSRSYCLELDTIRVIIFNSGINLCMLGTNTLAYLPQSTRDISQNIFITLHLVSTFFGKFTWGSILSSVHISRHLW